MNAMRLVAVVAALGCAGLGTVAHADAAAGKATFARACAECHEAGDFEGEDPKALAATLKSMVAGTMKHKEPISLTDAQIADVAAYMAAGGK